MNNITVISSIKDWHPADVVAAVRKAGWTLRKLSIHHGYTPTALDNALHRRWPKAERLIAEAIGVPPEKIWPSRYAQKELRS
ncbi:MAG: helix-turn-helix transcriptional regulator [Candidatus Competibacter sp.]|nr:helix-turn-helix transcriptional regulator [Candidatus Competibacter sp.]